MIQSLYLLVISLVSVVLFDLLFTFIRKRILFIPYAAVATGFIIALIIDPNANWYQIAVVCAIAMGAKNFIRVANRHIFNPAAVGLLAGGIIFSQYVTWWGVSFQSIKQATFENLILFLILLSPALVSTYRLRRVYSIITFLLAYTVLSHIFTFTLSISSIITRMFDPNVLFFSLVMLPEPMTSPMNPKRQVLYGLTVAIIIQLISTNFLPDLFIIALLLGNLLFFKYR